MTGGRQGRRPSPPELPPDRLQPRTSPPERASTCTVTSPSCPRCGVPVQPDWDWCHACNFHPDDLGPVRPPRAPRTTARAADAGACRRCAGEAVPEPTDPGPAPSRRRQRARRGRGRHRRARGRRPSRSRRSRWSSPAAPRPARASRPPRRPSRTVWPCGSRAPIPDRTRRCSPTAWLVASSRSSASVTSPRCRRSNAQATTTGVAGRHRHPRLPGPARLRPVGLGRGADRSGQRLLRVRGARHRASSSA